MELYWLQDFLALVRTGNFSKAAMERHVTQSAFSRRIQALEDWVGAPLFDRSSHPVELTMPGQQLLPIAVGSVEPLLDFRASMRANASESAPTVSFLMPTPCSAGIFPALLARLNREIGPIVGRGSVKRIDEVAERYAGGEADLALSYRHPSLSRPAAFDELESIEIGDEPLIPVCAPQRRGQPGYLLPVIPGSPLVYLPYGRSSFIGRVVDDEVASRVSEVRPQKLFEDPLIFVLKELALQGMGVAWLPRSTIERNLGDGSLARVGGGDWDIPLTVELLRRKKRLPPAAEAVWNVLATGVAPERPPLRTATPATHRPARARG
ncbi:MAG: LysR substrate-binding domain-containing protein [Betaproteobacteria bacterium]